MHRVGVQGEIVIFSEKRDLTFCVISFVGMLNGLILTLGVLGNMRLSRDSLKGVSHTKKEYMQGIRMCCIQR